MNKNDLALFGFKWNPFSPDIPSEALHVTPRLDHFGFRLEHKVQEGGFALLTGVPGTGKSVALRILAERLGGIPDVTVGVIEHPQSGVSDFYRELGELFGVTLTPRNRWGSFKTLREIWQGHIEATRMRPVLLIDEAQEMPAPVLVELKTLASTHFDSRSLLTTLLCGDNRLPERFTTADLVALGTRLRPRLILEPAGADELADFLRAALAKAGNARLMTAELIGTLVEHAAGNYRVLCGMATELLVAAAEREATQLDEKLFLEAFARPPVSAKPTPKKAKRRR